MKQAIKFVIAPLTALLMVTCPGIALQDTAITHENVSYGEHPNQILDFTKADVKGPAPLVIYIHGGAFNAGSHDEVDQATVQRYLDAGVHFASVEYRFRKHAELPAAFEDAVRALQFIRSKAEAWGIDKNRIGAYGGSAGGVLVSYLAWHDDFADPESTDPVARESSRLTAVAPKGVQATMDMSWWADNIPGFDKSGRKVSDTSDPKAQKLIRELSVINHISADDPPTFMTYRIKPDAPVPDNRQKIRGWVTHHVNFGIALEKKLKSKGVEVHLKYPGKETAFRDDVAFILHHLKK